ncbi:MAG TPA: biotin/lipoyl-containing protein, partial [Bradyrhizobium sp.]|nr:biotin/lipoyl-containing protein [Bradyrhizobium sp.]
MPTPILMPQLSPTMEEGRLAKWHVKEGDAVRSGDVVAEVETDKATMEVEAAEDGVIEKLLLAEGTEHVPVNHPIALLRVEDEIASPSARQPAAAPEREEMRARAEEAGPSPRAPDLSLAEASIAASAVDDGSAEAVLHQIAEQIRRNGRGDRDGKRVFASPLARRLARELGLELGKLDGSGPHGRIVKADIERAARDAMRQAEPVSEAEPEPQPIEQAPTPRPQELVIRREEPEPRGLSDSQVLALYRPGSYEIMPHDTMRKIIAERLTLSKQTIPHFYLAIDCDLDALLAARARLNALAPQQGPRAFKLSVN